MRPKLEVADIFRRHGDAFRAAQGNRLSQDQRKVMAAIEACRTPALGGHVERCEDCGVTRIAFNSCRDRHCPKCQGLARLQWLADRRTELLPVPYFHVVFTVPAPIAAIALQNKAIVYDIFQGGRSNHPRHRRRSQTPGRRDGDDRDPAHMGKPSPIILMFTASCQEAASDRTALDRLQAELLSSRPCSLALYRRLFLERLQTAFDAGDLSFHGELARLRDPAEFARYLKPVTNIPWVVFAKPPFASPSQILDYLGRYTHRVAIANGRLLDCQGAASAFDGRTIAPKTSPRR